MCHNIVGMSILIGLRVVVKNDTGHVRFIGTTEFAPGTWYGVELVTKNGRNDGSVDGVRYFECELNYGVFVRQAMLKGDEVNGSAATAVAASKVAAPSIEDAITSRPVTTRTSSSSSGRSVTTPLPRRTSSSLSSRSTTTPARSSSATSPPEQPPSALHNIINKLQTKLQTTTQDIRLYKEKIQVLESNLLSHNENITALESQLEMVSIDKEFQVSSKAKLELDLLLIKQQYEELKTDYQILQEEVELNKQIEMEIQSQVDLDNPSDLDVRTILLRNKQLEISLINLEKLNSQSELSFKKQIETLSSDLTQKDNSLKSYTTTNQQLNNAETKINSLQVQLDSTLELEKVIEHLNLENDKLTTRISHLEKTINELNELHELDKSLEESQHLVESDLRNDLKNLLEVIKQDKLVIGNLEKTNRYIEAKLADRKEITLVEDTADVNENLLPQINSLKLELSNYKSLNFQNSFVAKLSKIKLISIQDKTSLFNYGLYRLQYDLIFSVKTLISSCKLVMESIKGNVLTLQSIQILEHFLNLVLNLLESNITIGAQFQDLVFSLYHSFNNLIDSVKESNFTALKTDFIYDFITSVSKLITNEFNFITLLQLRFIYNLIHDVCSSANLVVNNLRFSLGDGNSSLAILSELSKSLIEVELDVEPNLTLEFNFETDVKVTEDLDLVQFCCEIASIVDSFTTLVQVLSLEKNLSSLGGTSLSNLEGISLLVMKILLTFKKYNTVEYTTVPNEVLSIYETLNEETKHENVEQEQNLSLALLEKDKKLHDFQLNIDLLENNMVSINKIHDEKIKTLLSDLNLIKFKFEESERRIIELTIANSKLTNELNELVKANQIYENGDMAGKFENMSTEKFFTNKMKMLEEMALLRTLVTRNFDSSKGSLTWLEAPLLQVKTIDNSAAVKFDYLSKSLKDLAINTKTIRIEESKSWKPKASTPRFINFALGEETKKYYNNRDSILRL